MSEAPDEGSIISAPRTLVGGEGLACRDACRERARRTRTLGEKACLACQDARGERTRRARTLVVGGFACQDARGAPTADLIQHAQAHAQSNMKLCWLEAWSWHCAQATPMLGPGACAGGACLHRFGCSGWRHGPGTVPKPPLCWALAPEQGVHASDDTDCPTQLMLCTLARPTLCLLGPACQNARGHQALFQDNAGSGLGVTQAAGCASRQSGSTSARPAQLRRLASAALPAKQ